MHSNAWGTRAANTANPLANVRPARGYNVYYVPPVYPLRTPCVTGAAVSSPPCRQGVRIHPTTHRLLAAGAAGTRRISATTAVAEAAQPLHCAAWSVRGTVYTSRARLAYVLHTRTSQSDIAKGSRHVHCGFVYYLFLRHNMMAAASAGSCRCCACPLPPTSCLYCSATRVRCAPREWRAASPLQLAMHTHAHPRPAIHHFPIRHPSLCHRLRALLPPPRADLHRETSGVHRVRCALS